VAQTTAICALKEMRVVDLIRCVELRVRFIGTYLGEKISSKKQAHCGQRGFHRGALLRLAMERSSALSSPLIQSESG
jgi:hypothetical protein